MAWGGKREGAGRKTKADEDKIRNMLSPYDELACEKLINGVKDGDISFIKVFLAYRFGLPKQLLDVTSNDETVNIPITTWGSDDNQEQEVQASL